jgi:nitronate monooxygenase
MPVIETALTQLLGIEDPILLAPMGSAAGGKLAAAVTHAGGLGLIGSGYASTKAIKQELAEAGNAQVGSASSCGRSSATRRPSTLRSRRGRPR